MAKSAEVYPTLKVDHIKNPSFFYAFPLVGILAKVIILIPVYIELFFLAIAYVFLILINSLVVLFTGKYWEPAYTLTIGIFRLSTKTMLFTFGLSNKYPGFNLDNSDPLISVDYPMPQKPNRLFAFPILGGLARMILLIPFFIYSYVIQYASGLGVFVSFFPVLFMRRYPESTYEFARDHTRLQLASSVYLSGLSDSYPSFWISMNHKAIKIILIVIAVLFILTNNAVSIMAPQPNYNNYNNYYYQDSETTDY